MEGKEPTATESGWIAHSKCTLCGNLYTEESGKNAVKLQDITVPATGEDQPNDGSGADNGGTPPEENENPDDGKTSGGEQNKEPMYLGFILGICGFAALVIAVAIITILKKKK